MRTGNGAGIKRAAVLLILLAAMLWCGSALAAGSGTCGENLTWNLDSNGVLTISGTGSMCDSPWENDASFVAAGVKKAVINKGVTGIGDWAFKGCSNLVSVDLPEGLIHIGNSAFWNCRSLRSIQIPDGVTYIGDSAFFNCSLSSARIPQSVETIPWDPFEYGVADDFVMTVAYGSAGWEFAVDRNYRYRLLPHTFESMTAQESIEVVYGKSAQIAVSTEPDIDLSLFAEPQLLFVSKDETVAAVSDTGVVKGVNPGSTTITVRDRSDPYVNALVRVTVTDKRAAPLNAYVDVSVSGNTVTADFGALGGAWPYASVNLSTPGWEFTIRNLTEEQGRVTGSATATVMNETAADISIAVTVTDSAGNTDTARGYFYREKRTSTRRQGVGTPTVQLVNGSYQYVYPSYETVTYTYWADRCVSDNNTADMMESLSVASVLQMKPGNTGTLNCTVKPAALQEQVVFFSDAPAVAAVEEDGTVTAGRTGTAHITAYAIDGSGLTAACTVYVVNTPASKVEVYPDEPVNETDCTQKLYAVVYPIAADIPTVTWESSDETVASIDENGLVTWHNAGSVIITATAADGSGVKGSREFTWNGILVRELTLKVDDNDPTRLAWETVPANATNRKLIFQTGDPSLLAVDEAGHMTFLGNGEAMVRAKTTDGSGVTAELKVAVHLHQEVGDAAVSPTCEGDGLTEGSHCAVCGAILVPQESIAALGHRWSEAVYTWSEDSATVSAKHVCLNDAAHIEEETVPAAKEITRQATCTADGEAVYTSGAFGNFAFAVQTKTETIPATGHTVVTDAAVEAECTKTGLTEGSHCSVCGEVLTKQELVEATGHTPVTDEAEPATCTEAGKTEGSHCSVCAEVLKAQETVPAKGHTPAADPAVEPTCTGTGLTEGSHCSECLAVLQAQETIPAKGHSAVTDPFVMPTCTETGLTEGSHCAVCGEVLAEQQVIPAAGHAWNDEIFFDWTPDNSACMATFACGRCGKKEFVPAEISVDVVAAPTTRKGGEEILTAVAQWDGKSGQDSRRVILPPADRVLTLAKSGKQAPETVYIGETVLAVPKFAADSGLTGVTYKSAKKKIAAIDAEGKLTLLSAGKTTITATAIQLVQKGKKTVKKKVSASVALTVVDPAVPVSISVAQENPIAEGKVYIGKDDGCLLKVTAKSAVEDGEAADTVTWKFSKPKILKVDRNTGLLNPVAAGTAKITATSTKNKKAKATITLTVVDLTVPAGIKITTAETTVRVGSPLKLDYELLRQEQDVEAKSAVTWKTSNKKIAKVAKDGTVTGLKSGTVTVTATTAVGKHATSIDLLIVEGEGAAIAEPPAEEPAAKESPAEPAAPDDIDPDGEWSDWYGEVPGLAEEAPYEEF